MVKDILLLCPSVWNKGMSNSCPGLDSVVLYNDNILYPGLTAVKKFITRYLNKIRLNISCMSGSLCIPILSCLARKFSSNIVVILPIRYLDNRDSIYEFVSELASKCFRVVFTINSGEELYLVRKYHDELAKWCGTVRYVLDIDSMANYDIEIAMILFKNLDIKGVAMLSNSHESFARITNLIEDMGIDLCCTNSRWLVYNIYKCRDHNADNNIVILEKDNDAKIPVVGVDGSYGYAESIGQFIKEGESAYYENILDFLYQCLGDVNTGWFDSLFNDVKLKLSLVLGDIEITEEHIAMLKAIEETGSLKEACNKLNITYPTLKSKLADLETSLGLKLVKTQRGGILRGYALLTEEGKRLVDIYDTLSKNSSKLLSTSIQKRQNKRVEFVFP